MGGTGVIDNFLGTFTQYIDSGFGLVQGDVHWLAGTLIVIDITLAGLFWAMAPDEDVVARLIRKTLYIGLFAFIIGNFNHLAHIVFDSFAGLGLKAGGSSISTDQFLQPGRLAQVGLDAGKPLLTAAGKLMGFRSFFANFVQIAVLMVSWVLVLIAFFILAVQLFVTILEFKLTTLAGFVLIPFALFRGRNFALMNWVSGAVAIGMMGIFLPFTIYLQSALGYSALKAGLVMAPASLVSMVVAPVAGRLTDKIGGKYILLTGLLLFALGMGWLTLLATSTANWPDFVPSLAIAGFGMGCTFAPMTTTAMHSVQPRLAGAASGMLNSVRQVGAVIGTAAVGALLENRLTVSLPAAAASKAATLPPAARPQFIHEFAQAAQAGAAVGAGQASSGLKAPPGTSPALITLIERLAREAFSTGYVSAMRVTMVLPIAVVLIGAVSCLWISRSGKPDSAPAAPAPEASQAPA